MTGSLVFILMGFVVGAAVVGIVWAIVSAMRQHAAARAEYGRNGIMTAIGELSADVDNAVAGYKLGSLDARALKETVRPKLEQINAKLKTNMKGMDPFFVKYVEKFVDDHMQMLVGLRGGSRPAPAPGEAIAGIDDEKIAQPDLFDESDKRTTAVPAIGTAAAASVLAVEDKEEAPAEEPAEEQPSGPAPDFMATQVMEAAPSPAEAPAAPPQKEETWETADAGAGQKDPQVEEEEPPVFNTYTPIEESGLLEDTVTASQEGEKEEPAQEPPFAGAPAGTAAEQPGESDTLAVPGDALSEQPSEDVEKTQAYDRESLSKAIDEEAGGPLDVERDDGVLTAEDDSAGESFIFGGREPEETSGVAAADIAEAGTSAQGVPQQGPAAEPAEQLPDALEQPARAPDAETGEEKKKEDEEEVFEVGPAPDADSDNDSLITGEDVIKKMDNFFGFDG
ncbi:MAG: hypothetical protein GF418_08610 [Chitinivibrionales bacterium]|nr:hypothetical protein [Chitinivibrionales bacterium]MBD3395674.1 hypothetical protein [Chitinivibrionales bacterium]